MAEISRILTAIFIDNFSLLSPLQRVKSVQSTLSHLRSPPEQMQSKLNFGSFLSKFHIHD